jgi:hypothetical protein
MSATCPECDSEYKSLGNHWRYNPEHRPELSDYQKDVVTGLLMGDGSLDSRDGNPILTVEMVNKEYLEELDRIFGVLSTGVKHKSSAEEEAKRALHSGFEATGDPSNYSDKYRLRTRSLPDLKEFNWYTTGEKIWPSDIKLTQTVLKHWYAGDGSLNNNGSRFYLEIHCSNEIDNKDKIGSYFDDIGISIDRWRDDNYGKRRGAVVFNKESAEKLLSYMGDPLPGFEYKWDQ